MRKSINLILSKQHVATFTAVLLLLITIFAPLQAINPAFTYAEDEHLVANGNPTGDGDPTAVDGRILTTDKTGDVSDWVEIAQSGDFSLIVRKNFINIYTVKKYGTTTYYNNPTYQTYTFGPTSTMNPTYNSLYLKSYIRDYINNWFNATPKGEADFLPANARLRDFTVEAGAKRVMGTSCSFASFEDGFSKPTLVSARTGDDVAFPLSYGEAANFLSRTTFLRNNMVDGKYIAEPPSSAIAIANYNKINLPYVNGQLYAMWLRSPGDTTGGVASLGNFGTYNGRLSQSSYNQKGYIYPALWVASAIFNDEPSTRAVTYNPNGGSGSILAKSVATGTEHRVPILDFRKKGHAFAGWNTMSDGSGRSFYGGQVFSVTADTTLYAQWNVLPPTSSNWPYQVEADPVAVNGRILTPDKTGDVSDWVEIAQNGKYSLIVRANYINIYPNAVMNGKSVKNDPLWQHTNGYSAGSTDYKDSVVRKYINDWFNGDALREADKLPADARLRAFTMQIYPQINLGTSTTLDAIVNGFSKPTRYQVGIGDDIAFALSYGESVNFLSRSHYLRDNFVDGVYVAEPQSSFIAKTNFAKVNIPVNPDYRYSMWLRSPGDTPDTVATLDREAITNPGYYLGGRTFQDYVSNAKTSARGLCYPALWVNSEIFTDSPKTPPAPIVAAPQGVDGRILPPDMTGDTEDWVELANIGDFSLIVRTKHLNIYPHAFMGGKDVRGDYDWQHTNGYSKDSTDYMQSVVRDYINRWFNRTSYFNTSDILDESDKLAPNARLREFTVQPMTKWNLGTCTSKEGLVNGFNRPTFYPTGSGNEVAFALSYSESANFLSKYHYMRGVTIANQPSNPIASANFDKITMPVSDKNITVMWLRSVGDVKGTVGSLERCQTPNAYWSGSRAFQWDITTINGKGAGFVYPALWVGSGIFDKRYYVTYEPNGGDGDAIIEATDIDDDSIIIAANTFQWLRHNFVNWNTKPDGTGDAYRVGDKVNMTEDIVLYAQWDPIQVICKITDKYLTNSRADINIQPFIGGRHEIAGNGVDPIVYEFDPDMYFNYYDTKYLFYLKEIENNPDPKNNRGTIDNLPSGSTLVKDEETGLYTLTIYPIDNIYPDITIYFAYCSDTYGTPPNYEPDIIYDPQG